MFQPSIWSLKDSDYTYEESVISQSFIPIHSQLAIVPTS